MIERAGAAALLSMLVACGSPDATPDGATPDAAGIPDAPGDDAAAAVGTPAPAGGWPVSSRCISADEGGCDEVEAETWDRTAMATMATDEEGVTRVTDADGATLITLTRGPGVSWFQAIGLTALPGGGWVLAGPFLGPGTLMIGATSIETPNTYNRLVAAVGTDGEPLWHLVFEGASNEMVVVAARTDGSVIVGGDLQVETTFGDDELSGPLWVYDFFLAATTPSGEWDWAIELPDPPTPGPTGDMRLDALELGPRSEAIALGELRGTLSVAGDTVEGPTSARAVADEAGTWIELAATP